MHKQERIHDQLAELKAQSLVRLVERLRRESLAFPVMAAEVEFYLLDGRAHTYPKALLATIDRALAHAGIAAYPAEEERGEGQYEVALTPQEDIAQLADAVQTLPVVIQRVALAEGMRSDFSPKPVTQDFGSGLHWHIHLENRRGENLFFREEGGGYSRELLWAMGGLLETLPDCMLFFAPQPEDYLRFQQPKMNAPTTISWGPNNRSTALRLPNKPLDKKHIEHRVSGANADPWLCILAILAGVAYGLEHRIYPGDAIYGEAGDPQYDAEPLPDYRGALSRFQQSRFLSEYIGEDICGEFLRRIIYPDAF